MTKQKCISRRTKCVLVCVCMTLYGNKNGKTIMIDVVRPVFLRLTYGDAVQVSLTPGSAFLSTSKKWPFFISLSFVYRNLAGMYVEQYDVRDVQLLCEFKRARMPACFR